MKIRVMIVFIFSIILIGCSPRKKASNDLEKAHLSGKIKSVETTVFSAVNKFGELSKGAETWDIEFISNSISYNNDGNIVQQEYDDGLYIFTYDSLGNKIEENHRSYKGDLREKYVYLYDHQGNMVEERHFSSDFIKHDVNSGLVVVYKYKYDSNGNKIEKIDYSGDGAQINKMNFKSDGVGNVIEEIHYERDGDLSFKINYEYDSDGNVIKENTSESEYIDGSKKYEYDKLGNKTMEKVFGKNGEVKYSDTYEYQFDKEDNWVKCIKSKNSIPELIIERKIVYNTPSK